MHGSVTDTALAGNQNTIRLWETTSSQFSFPLYCQTLRFKAKRFSQDSFGSPPWARRVRRNVDGC